VKLPSCVWVVYQNLGPYEYSFSGKEKQFRAHLSGKHCVRGDVFRKAYESAKRTEAK